MNSTELDKPDVSYPESRDGSKTSKDNGTGRRKSKINTYTKYSKPEKGERKGKSKKYFLKLAQ